MRECCNLAYAALAQGRDRAQMAELETALAPPELKQHVLDKVNAESMAALSQAMSGMGLAPVIPLKKNGA